VPSPQQRKWVTQSCFLSLSMHGNLVDPTAAKPICSVHGVRWLIVDQNRPAPLVLREGKREFLLSPMVRVG